MTHKCKSGQHTWLFREDAEKCCNGFRRVLVIGKAGMVMKDCNNVGSEPLPGGVMYGYKWVQV